jgi:hypothetical protein
MTPRAAVAEISDDETEAFLSDLTALCRRHDIELYGCENCEDILLRRPLCDGKVKMIRVQHYDDDIAIRAAEE